VVVLVRIVSAARRKQASRPASDWTWRAPTNCRANAKIDSRSSAAVGNCGLADDLSGGSFSAIARDGDEEGPLSRRTTSTAVIAISHHRQRIITGRGLTFMVFSSRRSFSVGFPRKREAHV
jgi:hypothetical protein